MQSVPKYCEPRMCASDCKCELCQEEQREELIENAKRFERLADEYHRVMGYISALRREVAGHCDDTPGTEWLDYWSELDYWSDVLNGLEERYKEVKK